MLGVNKERGGDTVDLFALLLNAHSNAIYMAQQLGDEESAKQHMIKAIEANEKLTSRTGQLLYSQVHFMGENDQLDQLREAAERCVNDQVPISPEPVGESAAIYPGQTDPKLALKVYEQSRSESKPWECSGQTLIQLLSRDANRNEILAELRKDIEGFTKRSVGSCQYSGST